MALVSKIVGVALLLAACMWSFIGWSLWTEYNLARLVGRTQGYNLTAALASELNQSFDSIDAAFRLITDAFATDAAGTPDIATLERLTALVRDAAGPALQMRIAGSDGRLMFPAGQPGSEAVGHQPHFLAHRDDPQSGMFVDPPGPAGQLEVSRRLETANGRFAGEAMLLLDRSRLMTLDREIDLGRRGMIVLAGIDGIVRAGFDRDHPDGSVGIGTDLNGAPYPSSLAPGQTAVFSRRGRIVGVERLVTIRRLSHYPLNVLIALDLDDVFGATRNHVWFMVLVGVGATAVIGILTVMLGREVWRRTGREIELAHDREQLHAAQVQITADRLLLDQTERDLTASQAAADAANRARSMFLAHVSHELRTPLHAIIGFSELIRDQAPAPPGSPPIASYAADIWSSGRHLLELINTVLDISKIESGATTLVETVFAVTDLARSSVALMRAQAEARSIEVDLRLPAAAMWVRADRSRLLQILTNLMSNAIKFTSDRGRITLSISEAANGELVFSIADTGIGMTEKEINVALEPFGQVDSGFSRAFEGTGLGLPLAVQLTELHGGRLELTSVKGGGTLARVVLPAARLLHREATRAGAD